MRTSEVLETVKSIKELLAKLEALVSETSHALTVSGGRSQDEIAAIVKKKECLRCGESLSGEKEVRGVHERCYQKLRRDNAIESAVAAGFCLPIATPGPKAAPAILLQVEESTKMATSKVKTKADEVFKSSKKK
jgi:hypothetical protein